MFDTLELALTYRVSPSCVIPGLEDALRISGINPLLSRTVYRAICKTFKGKNTVTDGVLDHDLRFYLHQLQEMGLAVAIDGKLSGGDERHYWLLRKEKIAEFKESKANFKKN